MRGWNWIIMTLGGAESLKRMVLVPDRKGSSMKRFAMADVNGKYYEVLPRHIGLTLSR